WRGRQSEWLASLFPAIPSVGNQAKLPQSNWPAEARELARSLLRREKLAKMQGGIEIRVDTESLDVRWGELSSRSRVFALLSAGGWFVRDEGDAQATLVQWCDGHE